MATVLHREHVLHLILVGVNTQGMHGNAAWRIVAVWWCWSIVVLEEDDITGVFMLHGIVGTRHFNMVWCMVHHNRVLFVIQIPIDQD